MRESRHIIGLGEVIYDHIFVSHGRQLTYVGSRGGGSVLNVLANIANSKGSATAVGVGGTDWLGEAAVAELRLLGVDTSHIRLLPKRRTRVIFETVQTNRRHLSEGQHFTFSTTCLVCQAMAPESHLLAHVRLKDIPRHFAWKNADFACFDRLTKNHLQIAHMFRDNGVRTALDLGRIGYLRYFPAAPIVAALGAFDIVLAPSRVASSLAKRAGLRTIDNLCRVGPRLLLCVSSGPENMTVYDTRDKSWIRSETLPAPQCADVIDDAGAGDTFLANLLLGLANHVRIDCDLEAVEHEALVEAGARAIAEMVPVLGRYGARGHIELPPNAPSYATREWVGRTSEQIFAALDHDKPCPFCGGKSPKRTSSRDTRVGSKHNTGWLLRRMFFTVERHKAVASCATLLKAVGTSYTVGTGGSYPVAIFLSLLLNQRGQLFSQSLRPFDYVRTGKTSDLVFVISYSGSTSDCAEVIKKALHLGVGNIVLVTSAAAPKLASLLRPEDTVISYGHAQAANDSTRSHRERGFVSITGTVAPCTLWTAAAFGPMEMSRFAQLLSSESLAYSEETVRELAQALREGQAIPVFGGGFAWSAMVDLESKFVEGGLGKVQLHEVKDFSHGRFISVMSPRHESSPIVFLGVGPWHEYEAFLLDVLRDDHRIITIQSRETGLLGALELLVRVQFFAQQCGESLGKDISRPEHIPSKGLELYRWKGGLG